MEGSMFSRLVCISAFLCAGRLIAQESADMRGLNHFYNLEYDKALAEFETAEQQDAQAIGPRNHLAQTLLYRGMYRNGALETELVSGDNPVLRREKPNPSPDVEQ